MATKKANEPKFERGEEGVFGKKGTSLKGDWLALAEAFGGVQGLADAIGVTPMTIYRWGVLAEPMRAAQRNWVSTLAASRGLKIPPMTASESQKPIVRLAAKAGAKKKRAATSAKKTRARK